MAENGAGSMRPEGEEELAEMLRAARGPLRIRGGGTRDVGRPVDAEAVLETGGIRGVTLYEPGALTLVARAGTPLAEIEVLLARENQRFSFEPADWRGALGTQGEPTLGGMVAANVSGPRRLQAGACRDSLIGLRFVDGAGQILKNGGRVMKNVTGYDLVKLLAGSWGTLGVLTELAFRVLPVPEARATLRLPNVTVEEAPACLARALGSPFEVTGAAWREGLGALIRIEGLSRQIVYRGAELQRLLGQGGAEVLLEADPATTDRIWRELRDLAPFAGQPGDLWRISVPPSQAPALLQRLGAEAVMLDWGGGLIWARMAPGTDLRSRIGPFAGHATLMRADPATRAALPAFQPEPPALRTLSDGLRARFDPRGILNPGLMA